MSKKQHEKWECKRCGWCCLHWGGNMLEATPADIRKWRKNNEEKILDRCGQRNEGKRDLWLDPVTRECYEICPWLERRENGWECRIYNMRPQQCREYKCTNTIHARASKRFREETNPKANIKNLVDRADQISYEEYIRATHK